MAVQILIAGGSAYPREWDYERFRRIADENDSIMHMDMAHISGLVAAGVCLFFPWLLNRMADVCVCWAGGGGGRRRWRAGTGMGTTL